MSLRGYSTFAPKSGRGFFLAGPKETDPVYTSRNDLIKQTHTLNYIDTTGRLDIEVQGDAIFQINGHNP